MSSKAVEVPFINITPEADTASLRSTVKKDGVQFQDLLTSMRQRAQAGKSPNHTRMKVRRNPTGEGPSHIIIDGFCRYEAFNELIKEGVVEPDYAIPCDEIEVDSITDVWVLQLSSNAHNIDTKPVEYANHLKRYIAYELEENQRVVTQEELARTFGKSPAFISKVLRLNNLDEKSKQLIEDGTISVGNAYNLARIPEEDRDEFIQNAITNETDEFQEMVAEFLRQKKLQNKQTAPRDRDVFKPVAKMLTKGEAMALYDSFTAEQLSRYSDDDLNNLPVSTWWEDRSSMPVEYARGFLDGMRALLSLSDDKIEEQRMQFEAKQAEKAQKQAENSVSDDAEEAADNVIGGIAPKGSTVPIGF